MSKSQINLPQLKAVMHYFGWEYGKVSNGAWLFRHKAMTQNLCYIKPMVNGQTIAKIDFMVAIDASIPTKEDFTKVKTWQGLFTAVRTHTKSLIYRREVLNHLQAA